MTEADREGIVRLPGEGETTSLFGDTYVVKAAGEETAGTLAVIEASLAPHSGGTPLHVNTLEDENYYVVEGTLTFRLVSARSKRRREPSFTSPRTSCTRIGMRPPSRSGYWASPRRQGLRCSSPTLPN